MPNTLEATIDIAAAPEQVWSVISDLKRMPEFSPNTVRMQPLGKTKTGTWTVNLNRDGAKFYPTTSRVVRFEPNRAIAFRMNENFTIWSFTLEPTEGGTRLIQRRDIPKGVNPVVRKLIDKVLGGEQVFEANLVTGMNETLGRIKQTVEK
ncbi:SRPBCC family protein [Nocardia sp. NBC_01503]|uniref:SRPBCC family protein n=1 Tax=Nocardia sp. NBC_01503 TaxID=2975997 RepID=UPI002E7BA7A0|nr:SRPBCC family protein [Nocardia sp. NBC_01503]WTL35108.1 SRPBCC family protein [Nocardia sp. NBC_01503]